MTTIKNVEIRMLFMYCSYVVFKFKTTKLTVKECFNR